LGAGALWAANGGSTVAYVDLYDNLMAHPNPNLAGGNATYYLPLKNEVLSILEGDNFTVDTFADIPANLSQYSLVYLEAYFACSPADEPAISNYIANGGGVVVWQGAICYLAYDSSTSNTGQDLSGVADWFGASYYVNTGGSAYASVPYPLGANLTNGEQLVQGVGSSDAGIVSMSNDSQVLATWSDGSTFAFTHAYGLGRVYWQATQFPITAPESQPPQTSPPENSSSSPYYYSSAAGALLGAGALWAANGGSTVAYVDLYDNLMAHPNPNLAGGNATYYLPLKNEVLSILEGDNFTVDTFADIPANLSQYSLVYLEAYFACSPADEPAISNYIANGGGVVVWQGAICYLAYDSSTSNTGQDLSGVADWFGASYFVNTGGDAYVTVANPLGTSLNVGDSLVTGVGSSNAGIVNMSAGSQVLATWSDGSTFAFTHAYGLGRVYWQATQNSENESTPISNPPTTNPPTGNPPAPTNSSSAFLISPSLETLNVNDSFTVTVNLTDAQNLFVWQIVLKYNGTDLRLDNMSVPDDNVFAGHTVDSCGPVPESDIDGSAGVAIGACLFGSDLIANVDNGVLCMASFTVINIGQSVIEVTEYSNPLLTTVPGSTKLSPWYSFWQSSNDALDGALEYVQGSNCTVSAVAQPTNTSLTYDPNVAETSISTDPTWVYQGETARINVTVSNIEDFPENVWVTLYYNITANKSIDAWPVYLEAEQNYTLQFTWNTAGLPCLNYTLTAVATVSTDSNTPSNGYTTVRLMGDVNGDGRVNLMDIALVARAFGSTPTSPNWNPAADLNGDGTVNMKDVVLVARNFGQHYP